MTQTILIVDDSKFMRDLIAFVLEADGFHTFAAEDGADALDILNSDAVRFDLILTDLNMPIMDGFRLIETVRAHVQYNAIPILMLTTESDPQKREHGKTLGATGWITKPFNPEKLLRVIKEVLVPTAGLEPAR